MGGDNEARWIDVGDRVMTAASQKALAWERDQSLAVGARDEDDIEKVKYKRRTIEFHPDIEKALDELQKQLSLRSHTDVVQKAVQVLSILVGDDKENRPQVFIKKKDGKPQEIIIV
jgi:hypothetical protein